MKFNNNPDKQALINAILSSSNGTIDRKSVNSAASGDISSLLSLLSDSDRNNLLAALSNPEAAKQVLSSDTANELLKKFSKEGGKNG